MPISQYTDIYYESLKLFRHFGSAVALGFKGKFLINLFYLILLLKHIDINGKADDILANQKLIKELNKLP